jgi:hypothetical protein
MKLETIHCAIAGLFLFLWLVCSLVAVMLARPDYFGAAGCLGVISGVAFFAWEPDVDFVASYHAGLAESNVHIGGQVGIESRLKRNDSQIRLSFWMHIAALVVTLFATLQWGYGDLLLSKFGEGS